MNAITKPILKPKKLKLGELLLELGLITEDQLRIALTEQKRSGEQLGAQLLELGFVTDSVIRDALSQNTGQESVDLANTVVDPEALKLVSKELAINHTVLPLSFDKEESVLMLAMADTVNIVAFDQIRAMNDIDFQITPILASEADIIRVTEQVYGFELSIDGILKEIETGEIDFHSLQAGTDEYSHPMVRLVDVLLADAVQREASDIHFEPEDGFLRIRYRIDGVLKQVRSLHSSYWSAMVVRLKVISGMNIAESRAPQDGRITMSLVGRQIDFRVAAQPTVHGENIVLRILDKRRGIVPLDKLGLTQSNLDTLKLMLAKPEGIILVTGPTGSGKTTTLYSVLSQINTESINIMTMEDPVEYPMQLIRQSSVNESAKMGFAEGIRSMMRQDPDVILIGEIRDTITAEMAFRAAMTGHQVFSTLHTNSAVGAFSRLSNIGILADMMAGNMTGIIAQRLIRRLCPHCKVATEASDLEKKVLAVSEVNDVTIFSARIDGCESCNNIGYKGRTTIAEILRIDGDLEDLIARSASRREILTCALTNGFKTVADDACLRVLDGTSSLEEISRVVDLIDRLES